MGRKRKKKKPSNKTSINTQKIFKDAPLSPPNDGFRDPEKKKIIPKSLPSPTKVYTYNTGRGRVNQMRWEQPEWDLSQTGRILDTESLVRRAFRVKKNLLLKEGYEISSPDTNRARYIKRRLQQMEHATGIPFPMLISQTISCLTRCNNAFWVKKRNAKASGGKPRKIGERTIAPVAGYFPVAPEDVRFKRDEYGKILRYEQDVQGKDNIEFAPEDVIHFHFDKREGFSVGTPILVPVANDILALRRIEENVELLIYQHLFPLFHYKVGTPDAPAEVYPDGTTEVELASIRVAQMPSDGCWVTPERHEVTALSVGSSPVPVEKVIEHFKKRIYIGLGVSSVDMGEGDTASKSTANRLSQNLIDDAKSDQREFGAQFYSKVITELLLESTFPDGTLFDEDKKVVLKFREIDEEAKQAKENHIADLYLKNLITHEEARVRLGYEVFVGEAWPSSDSKTKMLAKADGDFGRTNYGIFERDKVILEIIGKSATEAAVQTSQKTAGGKSIQNKNTPANQHGTRKSAKIKKDSFEPVSHIPELDYVFYRNPPVETRYNTAKQGIVQAVSLGGVRIKSLGDSMTSAFSMAKNELVPLCKQAYRIGLNKTGHFVWEVKIDNIDQRIQKHAEKYIDKLRDELLDRIDYHTSKDISLKYEDSLVVGSVFDVMAHRARMIDKSEILRAYNYGLASGYRLNGFKEMRSVHHGSSSCSKCTGEFLKYNYTDAIIYEELPPLHPLCTCTMEVTE